MADGTYREHMDAIAKYVSELESELARSNKRRDESKADREYWFNEWDGEVKSCLRWMAFGMLMAAVAFIEFILLLPNWRFPEPPIEQQEQHDDPRNSQTRTTPTSAERLQAIRAHRNSILSLLCRRKVPARCRLLGGFNAAWRGECYVSKWSGFSREEQLALSGYIRPLGCFRDGSVVVEFFETDERFVRWDLGAAS